MTPTQTLLRRSLSGDALVSLVVNDLVNHVIRVRGVRNVRLKLQYFLSFGVPSGSAQDIVRHTSSRPCSCMRLLYPRAALRIVSGDGNPEPSLCATCTCALCAKPIVAN